MTSAFPSSDPMPFESILQETAKSLAEYRNQLKWQRCVSPAASPAELDDPSVVWEDSSNTFEMPIGPVYWFRARYTVPDQVGGVSVEGSPVNVRGHVLVPTELYLDGKKVFSERYWVDFRKPEISLMKKAAPGKSVDILVRYSPVGVFEHEVIRASLWVEIESVEDVIFSLESFIHEMKYCAGFPELDDLRGKALRIAEKEIRPKRKPLEMLETIRSIHRLMAPAAEATKRQRVHLVGHAHIDMNWLWDMDDTIDICRRDFSTMTQLMKEFPAFTFSQSQTAVYDIAERHFPDVFKRMQKAVAAGNWDITAATWTEGDLNMANGEAVARHMMCSRKYLLDKFGKYTRVCWEPDTFGHPANMPQVLKKAGIHYYYHMRTSEGGPRYFHAETPLYYWEGLDGSRVLVFTSHYGPELHSREIVQYSRQLKRNHNLNDALLVYGVGDHGGGPTRRDIRRAMALDALPTMPRVVFSSTHAFFDSIVEQHPINLPVWKGEMNPIFDGCYTSHGDIKRYNRHGENRLLEAETAGALALVNGGPYDDEALEQSWRTLCFNQFHDIFDGCAIHSTYELAGSQMAQVLADAARMKGEALSFLSSRIRTGGKGAPLAVWNLQGFIRDDLVETELPKRMKGCRVVDDEGDPVASQVVDGKVLFVARDVPAMGYRTYALLAAEPVVDSQPAGATDQAFLLSSESLEVRVDRRSGCILHMLDKETGKIMIRQRDWSEGRHLANNIFHVEYEIPHGMSAWIIGAIARVERLVRGAKVGLKASGPVVDILEIENTTGHSTIRQEVLFHKGLKRIDFRTRVDWREQSDDNTDAPMLKLSFLPELANPSKVTWDIPFGNVTRVADGTEFAAQKWIDVSDDEAGFSLLNDCKYGFSATGNTLTMTCIRTSCSPDPVPDRGLHEFSYALLPHAGGWQAAHTVRAAAGFNSPLVAVPLKSNPKGELPPRRGWIDLECEGAIVTCLKKAEGSDALLVRIQESRGESRPFALKVHGLGARRVEEVSLLEDKVFAVLPLVDGVVAGKLGPYEIKTVRIWR